MRQQYFFRESAGGLLAWDVHRLIALSSGLPQIHVRLESISELDEAWSGDMEGQSWRQMVAHLMLIDEADPQYPIILAADGRVMDGMHRVAKALRAGATDILAVRFTEDPPPDYVGRSPEDLPYD